ncbi:MAG TPA: dihydroneopterin aldolase [Bacillota bacterium]|nr:dihydroneopterin aldolase [Bacillota bacterium]
MDKIMLNNMQFYGFHGLFPEENKLGQRFHVDVVLFADLLQAGMSDDMDDSVDYGAIYETVKGVVEQKVYHLLEAVADAIANELLATYSLVNACTIRVKKPDPPIPGHYDSVAVEIHRERIDSK